MDNLFSYKLGGSTGTWLTQPFPRLKPCPNKYRVQDIMEPHINQSRTSMIGQTFEGNHDMVSALLKSKNVSDGLGERNSDGQTAVHIAVYQKR